MERRVSIIYNIDWLTVGLYLMLVFMGCMNIYAAVYNEEHNSIFDFSQKYGKQLIWIGAAFFIIIVVFLIDSKFYSTFSYVIYGVILLTLAAVLIFGREVHGARSWFEIGSIRIQPSEFAKFATNLALSAYLSRYNLKIHKLKSLIIICAIMFTPASMIMLQNDTGSAIVYGTFVLVLYREGLSGTYLLLGVLVAILFILSLIYEPIVIIITLAVLAFIVFWFMYRKTKETFVGAGILLGVSILFYGINYFLGINFAIHFVVPTALVVSGIVYCFWAFRANLPVVYLIFALLVGGIVFSSSVDYFFHNVLEDHQRIRINVLLGIQEDLKGAGYNVHQSKIAIGSGGLTGKGFLQGTQTKFDFVPEQSTDFIFCTIGEEWGFLGTAVIILLFLTLLIRLIYLAERQRSTYSRVYGYGVVAILFFHVAINIGMTIGLAPVIGIPLPFFSYGGSSLWAFTILLFIFLRFDASRMALLQ